MNIIIPENYFYLFESVGEDVVYCLQRQSSFMRVMMRTISIF